VTADTNGEAPQRSYGRGAGELRPVEIEPGFMRTATGSALISAGETRVICTASAEESVPRWMKGRGTGWVTSEYGMLPASTGQRKQRDATRGRQDGRTVEIQRLIGRSLRGVVDFKALGERTIYLDCDVLQADGGTRCASITGAYVALALACARLREQALLERSPLSGSVAAVSCGMVGGRALLDLDYSEDSNADVDVNVVMTGDGRFIEVQSTAEKVPFDRERLDDPLATIATLAMSSHVGFDSFDWESRGPAVCAAKTRLPAATDRERTISTCLRLTGFRACFCAGALRGAGLDGIPAIRIQSGENSVLDRTAKKINFGGGRAADLDVLDANPVQVLAGGRIADAELFCREFERQA